MNKLDSIIERYSDTDFLVADGFDDAIIGVCDDKLVYSITKCIEILMERNSMSSEVAYEYFDFNVLQAYVGDKTPIWVDDDI